MYWFQSFIGLSPTAFHVRCAVLLSVGTAGVVQFTAAREGYVSLPSPLQKQEKKKGLINGVQCVCVRGWVCVRVVGTAGRVLI